MFIFECVIYLFGRGAKAPRLMRRWVKGRFVPFPLKPTQSGNRRVSRMSRSAEMGTERVATPLKLATRWRLEISASSSSSWETLGDESKGLGAEW